MNGILFIIIISPTVKEKSQHTPYESDLFEK